MYRLSEQQTVDAWDVFLQSQIRTVLEEVIEQKIIEELKNIRMVKVEDLPKIQSRVEGMEMVKGLFSLSPNQIKEKIFK
jgi:hypothetical protein